MTAQAQAQSWRGERRRAAPAAAFVHATGAAIWLSYFGALVIVILSSKFYGLLAAHEQWSESPAYTAAAATASCWREVVLAGVLSAGWAALTSLARHNGHRVVVAVLAALAGLFVAAINVINAELLPYYGAPLSLDLIWASDVFASDHGRSAVLSWISPEAWTLVFLIVAAPFIAAAAVQTMLSVFRIRWLVGAAALFVAVIMAAGMITRATPDVFATSGTLHFLRSVPAGGGVFSGREVADVAPLRADRIEPPVLLGKPASGPFRAVIMVVLESAGAEFFDPYRDDYGTTPNLKALLDEAAVVSPAYAQAVTSTRSTGVIFTSRYPPISQHKLPTVPIAEYQPLPRLLETNGVRTGFFHSSDLRFDRVDQFLSRIGFRDVGHFRTRPCGDPPWDDGWGALGTTDRCTFSELVRWIDQDREAPLFATVWTFQSHYPYYAGRRRIDPQSERGASRRTMEQKARYLSAIAEADALIGSLVRELESRGLYEDTLLIVTSDHGESFVDVGAYGHRGLSEHVIRVPLILISPRLKGAQQVPRLTGHVDLAPTIANAFGVEPPESWDGRSLFEWSAERPVFFSSLWAQPAIGYRFRDRKVVHMLTTGATKVYDLSADPRGSRDLAGSLPEQWVRQESDRIFNWARATNARWQAAGRDPGRSAGADKLAAR